MKGLSLNNFLFLTELQGRSPHVTALLRNHGYISHHHLADHLPRILDDLPEARLPRNILHDPLGCLIAYNLSSPWAKYIQKLPPASPRLRTRLSSLLVTPPHTTPTLLICTYHPAGHDPAAVATYRDLCTHIATLTAQFPHATTILGGDLQTQWLTPTAKGRIL